MKELFDSSVSSDNLITGFTLRPCGGLEVLKLHRSDSDTVLPCSLFAKPVIPRVIIRGCRFNVRKKYNNYYYVVL